MPDRKAMVTRTRWSRDRSNYAPREILELFVALVELNALAVELFLEDEFAIRVFSRLELTSGVESAPARCMALTTSSRWEWERQHSIGLNFCISLTILACFQGGPSPMSGRGDSAAG